MICLHPNCDKFATRIPQICVPEIDRPKAFRERLKATINVPLCKEHCEAYDVSTFLKTASPDGKHTNIDAFLHMASPNNIHPDFARAYVRCIQMKSKEAKGFVRAVMRTLLADKARDANLTISPQN